MMAEGWIHLCVVALSMVEVVAGLRRGRAGLCRIIIFAAFGLIHGLVPMLTPRQMMWPFASDESIELSAWLTLLGSLCLSVGWRMAELRSSREQEPASHLEEYLTSKTGQLQLRILFWVVLGVSTAAWLAKLSASAGSLTTALEAHRFEYRGEGNVYLAVMMSHVSALAVLPGFLGFFLPKRYQLGGVLFGVLMALIMFFSTQGARGPALSVVGAIGMGFALRDRLRPARKLGLVLIGGVILALSVSLYSARKVMSKSTVEDVLAITASQSAYENALTRDPLNYHQFFVAAVEHFPRDHDYLNGATYRRIVFFFVPREWIPSLKPEDTHVTFAYVVLGGNESRTTIPPSMLGDGYINFWGVPGVVIVMVLNGWLLSHAGRLMLSSRLGFLVIGSSYIRTALFMMRGSPYEAIATLLSSVLLVTLLASFTRWLVGPLVGDRTQETDQEDAYVLQQQRNRPRRYL